MSEGLWLLYDRWRQEEKLLAEAFAAAEVAVEAVYAPGLSLELGALTRLPRLILNRCVSATKAAALGTLYGGAGSRLINAPETVATCSDKLATDVALRSCGVPAPRSGLAFEREAAAELAASLGYPVVMKPVVGSWGRMVTRLSDRDALDAVIEHRVNLGSPSHKLLYLQEHIDKPGRDIRAFVLARPGEPGEVIAAIYRYSDDWITNTARGGVAHNCPVTEELTRVATAAAKAVGGGMLAIDLVESERGLLVIEVNHNMEFRNSIAVTGVDIPGRMVAYVAAELARA